MLGLTRDARLWSAAGLAAAVHALAGAAAWRFLLPAAPGAPLADRLAYLQGVGWGWRLAWVGWVAAGVTLLWLLLETRRRLPGSLPARVAPWLAAAALAVDLPCDVAQGWLLPALAHEEVAGFLELERRLVLGGYSVANGLYSLAALLMSWAVARHGAASLLVTGLPLVASGLWLAWLGVAATYAWAPAAATATVGLGVVWMLHLPRVLTARPRWRGPL